MRPVREPLRLPTAEREALMAAAIADAAPECGEDGDRLAQKCSAVQCSAMRDEMGWDAARRVAHKKADGAAGLAARVDHGKACVAVTSDCERPGNLIL
jgi:Arc/MetJ family transcription regulator